MFIRAFEENDDTNYEQEPSTANPIESLNPIPAAPPIKGVIAPPTLTDLYGISFLSISSNHAPSLVKDGRM